MIADALSNFNAWGFVALVGFVGGYSLSHWFHVKHLSRLDLYSKLFGFSSLVGLFLVSGWKAGLLALPVGFVGSALSATALRVVYRTP